MSIVEPQLITLAVLSPLETSLLCTTAPGAEHHTSRSMGAAMTLRGSGSLGRTYKM